MKSTLLLSATAIVATFLTGCFDVETVVHLKKDGKGTIVREIYFDEGRQVMLNPAKDARNKIDVTGEGSDIAGNAEFYDEVERMAAAEMGAGVSFVGMEKIKQGNRNGCRITYQFQDINTVEISPEEPALPGTETPETIESGKGFAKPVTFTFANGVLTIHSPRNDLAEIERLASAKAQAGEATDEGKMTKQDLPEASREKLKAMTAKDKLALRLVIDDGIASTNASFERNGSITLMEVDNGKFSKDAAASKKVEEEKGLYMNFPAAAEKLKDIPGITIEPKDEIRVSVK